MQFIAGLSYHSFTEVELKCRTFSKLRCPVLQCIRVLTPRVLTKSNTTIHRSLFIQQFYFHNTIISQVTVIACRIHMHSRKAQSFQKTTRLILVLQRIQDNTRRTVISPKPRLNKHNSIEIEKIEGLGERGRKMTIFAKISGKRFKLSIYCMRCAF